MTREGGVAQLDDDKLGEVVVAARPVRPDGHGDGWAALAARRDRIVGWLDEDVPVVKIGELLAREGVTVAQRTLHRFWRHPDGEQQRAEKPQRGRFGAT